MNTHTMIDHHAWPHLARARRNRPKMQPRWRDQIEILCIRKKREHFVARLREQDLRLEIPDAHELSTLLTEFSKPSGLDHLRKTILEGHKFVPVKR